MGLKAPSLPSNDNKKVWIERPSGHTFAVFCPAQAYPIPAFRLIIYRRMRYFQDL